MRYPITCCAMLGLCATLAYGQNLSDFHRDFTGIYSSKHCSDTAQAPYLREQEMLVMPIQDSDPDRRWYYWGWFPAHAHDHPLGELLACVYRENDTLKLSTHLLPESLQHQQPWLNPEILAPCLAGDLPMEAMHWIEPTKKGWHLHPISNFESRSGSARAYTFIRFDMRFENKRLYSHTKFLTKDLQTVFDHNGFYFDNLHDRFKKF